MSRRPASLLCLSLVLVLTSQAMAASKHFKTSFSHFNEFASKAADLYFKSEQQTEKNLLSHLTAISAIYAERANAVMGLTDVLEHLTAKRDKAYTQQRIQELKQYLQISMPYDIKHLADLVESQENREVRAVGTQVLNEMRVFERNVDNL